jgi:sugar/nucleoside kinase (ribokinase family)
MSILVVGSVAFDSVKTPFGQVQEILGGAASFFSVAASFFSQVNMVAVVGDDFPAEHIELYRKHSIDVRGLQKSQGKTFRWVAEYGQALNEAKTLETHLNVFEHFSPEIPDEYKDSDYVFLANIDPVLQKRVLTQVRKPGFVACDTMNYWITSKLKELKETLSLVNILIINDQEVRMLAHEANLTKAARIIQAMGPEILVVKKGEYGVSLFTKDSIFSAPAFPLESVYDPTGAGDTFAGGFVGYLAKVGKLDNATLRKAVVYGTVMASFACEDFSLNRLDRLTPPEIRERFNQFHALTDFDLDEAF